MSGVDWEILGSVFEEDPEVIAAWVFGSEQEGVVRPEGDLNIFVYSTPTIRLTKQEHNEL
jgi:hypothetical protein